MPLTVEGPDDRSLGLIREDRVYAGALNFWVVGAQLRKGAATSAVQIGERLLSS